MKKAILFLMLSAPALSIHAQTSTFDLNDEGWTLIGDPTSFTPFHSNTGGNPNGYCYFVDGTLGQYCYWVAPNGFTGNKSASFRKYLTYDLKQTFCVNQSTLRAEVILERGSLILLYDDTATFMNGNPDTSWTHYDIPLWDTVTTGHWWRDSLTSGIHPTNADFQNVLGNLDALKIRGEYSFCTDTGSIDNVTLESGAISVQDIRRPEHLILLYPNPASTDFTIAIESTQPVNEFSYIISDALGKTLSECHVKNKITNPDISSLSDGIYFLHVHADGETFSRKLILNR